MYRGFRNHQKTRKSVEQANSEGISERIIPGQDISGRVVKILLDTEDTGKKFLTLVQQPGDEPKAFLQDVKLTGPHRMHSPVIRPTGDLVEIVAEEAISITARSFEETRLIAGSLGLATVVGFFPDTTQVIQN